MSSPAFLFLVSAPRSGSTQCMDLISLHRGLATFHEVFHGGGPDAPTAMSALYRAAGLPPQRQKDPALRDWVHADPWRTLRLLRDIAPSSSRTVVTKLFPRFLGEEAIERELAGAPDTAFLVLTRRPIDAYVSLLKARAVNRWANFDSTHLRPALDPAEFAAWHEIQSGWFQQVQSAIGRRGRPMASLTYEQDILGVTPQAATGLRRALAEVGVSTRLRWQWRARQQVKRVLGGAARLVGARVPWREGTALVRQDRSASVEDKVSNWEAFCAGLSIHHDLQMLERYDAN